MFDSKVRKLSRDCMAFEFDTKTHINFEIYDMNSISDM